MAHSKPPPKTLFLQDVQRVGRELQQITRRIENMDGIMIDPVEFGQLRAEVAAQRRDLDRLADTLEHLARSMDSVRDVMTEAKGGWRAIAMVSGIAGTVGGAITWAVEHIRIG
jgi:methyl-accepting chemotaxis protein